MKTTDERHKEGVETGGKYREETFEDTLISSDNVKESQQTLFASEDENKKAKITVHTTEEAMITNKECTPVRVWCGYENT